MASSSSTCSEAHGQFQFYVLGGPSTENMSVLNGLKQRQHPSIDVSTIVVAV